MISERYAVVGRPSMVAGRVIRTPWWGRITARPALSGKERVAEKLGQSLPVQLALAMTLIAFAAMLYLFQASQGSVLEMKIWNLQSQQTQLLMQSSSLQTSVTALKAVPRIDSVATTQLHMTRPDITKAIWIQPVVPVIPSPVAAEATTLSAQRASQPMTWLGNFLGSVVDSF